MAGNSSTSVSSLGMVHLQMVLEQPATTASSAPAASGGANETAPFLPRICVLSGTQREDTEVQKEFNF